jgi:hypothetical protein
MLLAENARSILLEKKDKDEEESTLTNGFR